MSFVFVRKYNSSRNQLDRHKRHVPVTEMDPIGLTTNQYHIQVKGSNIIYFKLSSTSEKKSRTEEQLKCEFRFIFSSDLVTIGYQ